jgi:hypothetical protein
MMDSSDEGVISNAVPTTAKHESVNSIDLLLPYGRGTKDASTDPAGSSFVNVQPIWRRLDEIVAEFRGKSKVSGGFFCIPANP